MSHLVRLSDANDKRLNFSANDSIQFLYFTFEKKNIQKM